MIDIKIQYDGYFPCRCKGTLIVHINGKQWNFGECLESGGKLELDVDNYILHVWSGPWKITRWPPDFPEQYKFVTLAEINEQIEHGCCGGCE